MEILLFVWMLSAQPAEAAHGRQTWINQYKDEKGGSCCGATDCIAVPARVVSQSLEGIVLEIGVWTVTKHPKSVHFVSHPDSHGSSYVCTRPYFDTVVDDVKVTTKCPEVLSPFDPAGFPAECIRCVLIGFGG